MKRHIKIIGISMLALDGVVIGMSTFGESAPGPVVMEHFGFTAENIQQAIESL